MIINEMNEDNYKKATDKGWAAMRGMLDQEMPVQQERRRFAWWWFALLLLPLAAIGSWHLWTNPASAQGQQEESGQPSTSPAVMTNEQPKQVYSDVPLQRDAGNAVNELQKTETQPKAVTSSAGTTSVQSSTSTGSSKNKENSKINHHAQSNKTVHKATDSPAIVVQSNAKTPAIETKTSTIHTENSTSTSALDNSTAETSQPVQAAQTDQTAVKKETDFLNPLSVQPNPVKTTTEQDALKPATVNDVPSIVPVLACCQHTPRWSFGPGIYASSDFNNLGAGMAVQWQPARRFGIRSGLYYNRYTPSSSSQPITVLETSTFESTIDPGSYLIMDEFGNTQTPITNTPLLQEPVVIAVKRMDMIEMPLLLTWNVWRPLKVFAGVNSSYLMKTAIDQQAYSGDLTLKFNSVAANERLSIVATEDIARWRFGFQTGLGFSFGRRFELALMARLPFNPINAASASDVANNNNGQFNPNTDGNINSLKKQRASFFMSATYFLFQTRK